MSVLKSKRKESKFEFYAGALKLREDIIYILLRDFGVKTRMRDIDFYASKMSEEDAQFFESLLDKYEIQHKLPEEYPNWLIHKFRDMIFDTTQTMIKSITSAYSIWPTNQVEVEEKRIWQDRAIGACENLLQDFTLIIDILPVNANKYVRYVDMIEKEIKLLKGWRKSCNKFFKGTT